VKGYGDESVRRLFTWQLQISATIRVYGSEKKHKNRQPEGHFAVPGKKNKCQGDSKPLFASRASNALDDSMAFVKTNTIASSKSSTLIDIVN
jgi:hypothetical protein